VKGEETLMELSTQPPDSHPSLSSEAETASPEQSVIEPCLSIVEIQSIAAKALCLSLICAFIHDGFDVADDYFQDP
jgi:hypothetical protein